MNLPRYGKKMLLVLELITFSVHFVVRRQLEQSPAPSLQAPSRTGQSTTVKPSGADKALPRTSIEKRSGQLIFFAC